MKKQKLSLLFAVIFTLNILILPLTFAKNTSDKVRLSDYNYYPRSDIFNPDKNPFLFNPKKPQKGALSSIKPFDNSKPITDFSQFETTYNFTDKLFKLFPSSDLKERWIVKRNSILEEIKLDNVKTAKIEMICETINGYRYKSLTSVYLYPVTPPPMGVNVAVRAGVYPWDLQIYSQKPMTRRDMAVLLARTLQFFTPGYMLDIDDSYQQYFQLQGKDETLMPVPKGLDISFAAEGFPWRTDLRQYYYKPSKNEFLTEFELHKLYEQFLDILPDEIKPEWKKIYNWANYAGNIKDVYTIPPTDLKACTIVWMLGLMDLKNGYFKPFDFVTKQEADETLKKVQKLIPQRVKFLPFYQLNPLDLGKDTGYVLVYDQEQKKYKKVFLSETPLMRDGMCGYNNVLENKRLQMCYMPSIYDQLSLYWKFKVRSDIKPVKMPSYPLPKNKNVLITSPHIPAYLYDIYLPIAGQVNHKSDNIFVDWKGKDLKSAVQKLYEYRRWKDQILLPAGLRIMYSVDYRNVDKILPVQSLTDGWWGLQIVRNYTTYRDIAEDLALREPHNFTATYYYAKNTLLNVPVEAYMDYRVEQIKKYKIVSEAHVYYSFTRPDVGILRIIYYPPTDKNWLKTKGLTTGKWYDIYFYYDDDRTSMPSYLYTLDLSPAFSKKNPDKYQGYVDWIKSIGVTLEQ